MDITGYIFEGMFRMISFIGVWAYMLTLIQLLIYLFFIAYVYKDAPKHGMDRWFWTLLHISIPVIGILAYIVIRTVKDHSQGYPYVDETGDEIIKGAVKSPIMKLLIFVAVLIVITIFMWMVGGSVASKLSGGFGDDTIKTQTHAKVSEFSNNGHGMSREKSRLDGTDEGEMRFKEDGVAVVKFDVNRYSGNVTSGIYYYDGNPILVNTGDLDKEFKVEVKKNTIYRVVVSGNDSKLRYDIEWELEKNE